MEGILRKEIPIPIGGNKTRYRHIISSVVGEDTNIELETITPTTDEEWLDFFARAVGKEIKLVNNHNEDQFMSPFFPKISSAKSYKRNAGEIDDPASSAVIFVETLNALYHGNPFEYNDGKQNSFAYIYKELPTTLFLYYRMTAGGVPRYVGHIFILPNEIEDYQKVDYDDDSFVYFVSIYKSVFEKALKKFSDRVITDIIAYTKRLGEEYTSIVTNPLPGPMEYILEKKGFQVLERRVPGTFYIANGNYVLPIRGGARQTRRRRRRKTRKPRLRRRRTAARR
jgi:hypothetical protein